VAAHDGAVRRPAVEIREIKQQPGRDIVVTGSITLCHALIEAELVDEYRLFVFPVVQGRGRRLFPDGVEIPSLKLRDAKAFRSGIAFSRYVTS
jgi:dihydrofolate reductase